jgi:hypothetical protein
MTMDRMRSFTDLNDREWDVASEADPLGGVRRIVFRSGVEYVVLNRPPRHWPNCSDDDLRAALTLAHIYEVIAQGHA